LEYNFLALFLILGLPFYFYAILLTALYFLDVVFLSSSIFYLTWIDLFEAGRFFYLHEDILIIVASFTAFLVVIIGILWGIYNKISWKISKVNLLIYLFTSFAIIFVFDIINGSSRFNNSTHLIKRNAASSILLVSYKSIQMQVRSSLHPRALSVDHKSSATFSRYKSQNVTDKQLVIICESWGMLKNYDYKKYIDYLKVRSKGNYEVEYNNTFFKGSTTYAELRELVNQRGNYKYYFDSLSINNEPTDRSIFDIKRGMGYKTIGVHSFSGAMFYRKKWWINIGIEEAYFSEDILRESMKKSINSETSFYGVNDEDAFDFISIKAAEKDRVFAYLLTVNTHLPFYYKVNNKSLSSHERKDLIHTLKMYGDGISMLELRIFEEIMYFVSNLSKYSWDEVLIVGDHPPPFSDSKLRREYDQNRVPYIFIKKVIK
jgi:hypothetical protein